MPLTHCGPGARGEGRGREGGRGSAPHAPPLGAVRALIGPSSSRRRRRLRPRSAARPRWPLIFGAWERAAGSSRLLASSSPGVCSTGPNVSVPRLLLPSVSSHGCDDELCMGHGATLSKANHVLFCSAVSFTPRTAPGYIFPLFPSGGGALWMPAAGPGPIVWRWEPNGAGQRQGRAVPIGAFEMSWAVEGTRRIMAPPLQRSP